MSLKTTMKQWYHDDYLERDLRHVLEDPTKCATSSQARYVLLKGNRGMFHLTHQDSGEDTHHRSVAEPLYLSYDEVQSHFGNDFVPNLLDHQNQNEHDVLIWIGNKDEVEYWALYLAPDAATNQHDTKHDSSNLQTNLSDILDSRRATNNNNDNNEDALDIENSILHASPLREFGDRLKHLEDAGVLATANGLVEFHKSHGYCSKCGSPTVPTKLGTCRCCTQCRATVYPRIDVAAIMLITSPCGQYGLLGRKAMWPKGRYSTLAGFVEVGETLEQCCVRETLEESGVRVDPSSVQFVCSQPWPFPRSLMVGFRAVALNDHDSDYLPRIGTNVEEMEDCRWFPKEFVASRLEGGSTALGYKPTEREEEFHIPGRASLARILITQWVMET